MSSWDEFGEPEMEDAEEDWIGDPRDRQYAYPYISLAMVPFMKVWGTLVLMFSLRS